MIVCQQVSYVYVYICMCVCVHDAYIDSSKVGESPLSWHESASVRFTQAPVKLSSRSSTPSPTPLFSADPVVFKASCQSSAVSKTESTKLDVNDVVKTNPVTSSAVEVVASSRPTSAGLSFAAVAVAVEKRETASQTCSAPKRQMPESDDNADDDEIATPLFVNKKQRIQNAELAQREGKISQQINLYYAKRQ